MKRLHNRKLAKTIGDVVRKALEERNHSNVDFCTVRKLYQETTEAYINGTHSETSCDSPTAKFVEKVFPRILERYWGLKSHEYAIYGTTYIQPLGCRVQVCFHPNSKK